MSLDEDIETSFQDLETTEDFPRIHATETLGTDLLGALLDEIKILPKPWQMLPQHQQNEIIDRLRERVKENVQRAVTIIAQDTRVTVTATLKEVKFQGGIEAKLVLSKANQHRLDLADNVGEQVLVVIMPAEHFTNGMDDVQGDADQPDILANDDVDEPFDDDTPDPFYADAVSFVRDSKKTTIAAVQHHLRIGYNRAAALIERMESEGVISAMDKAGRRKVIE